ncbi:MAG: hypothetical protein ACW974_07695 [Candidatus Thorarchaeota archaeon]
MDSYPIEIIPPDVLMPTMYSLPIIHATSYYPVVLTWIGWSASGSYTLYLNNTQIEAGLWTGPGSFQIPLHDLPEGVHIYQLSIRYGTFVASSTAVIRIPGFDLLNDFDEDEMYDLWEIKNGFDPTSNSDASEDADSDELTNLQEHNLGTDPHSSDSDGDSMPDFWEVSNGFDPLSPDIPFLEYVVYFRGYVIGIPAAMVLLGAIAVLLRRLPEETKARLPIKGSISYGFWLKLSIIFCFLLLVPSEIHFGEEYRVDVPYYYFSIGSVFMYYSSWQDAGNFDILSLESYYMEPITFLSAIVILLPAIYLNRKLRNRPADAPILDLGLAALFVTIILAFWFVEYLSPSEFLSGFQSLQSWNLLYFGTLVIIVLILLPLFSREAFLWGEERVSEERKASRTRIPWSRKYSLMGYAWGLATFLIPLVAIIQLYDFDAFSIRYESPLYIFRMNSGGLLYQGVQVNWMMISLDVYQIFGFVNFLIAGVFHIVFAFHVLRYLRGMTSRKRVIQAGVLSILAPIIYHTVVASNPIAEEVYAYPIPIVLIIGVVATLMIKPNVTRIRTEESEKDDKPHPVIPEDDGSIQVPLFYYFKNKLMDFLRRRSKSKAA